MKKYGKALLFCSLLAVATGIVLFTRESGAKDNAKKGVSAQKTVLAFADYRKWTLVNPKPYFVWGPTAALCIAPPPRKIPSNNPHADKFIRVYVNPTGRAAMLTQKTPRFPVGSILVKEKLTTQTSVTPELLTVMVKRGKGWNPSGGDWEYLVANGAANKVEKEGKLEKCQSCHAPQATTDFVFRHYLPEEARKSLK